MDTVMPVTEPIKSDKQIDVLLKEYDALRREIDTRISTRWTFVALAGGIYGFWKSKEQDPSWGHTFTVAVAAVILIALWWWTAILLARCNTRIAAIEKYVNRLAGKDLLSWESQHAALKMFRLFQWPLPKPAPWEAELPKTCLAQSSSDRDAECWTVVRRLSLRWQWHRHLNRILKALTNPTNS